MPQPVAHTQHTPHATQHATQHPQHSTEHSMARHTAHQYTQHTHTHTARPTAHIHTHTAHRTTHTADNAPCRRPTCPRPLWPNPPPSCAPPCPSCYVRWRKNRRPGQPGCAGLGSRSARSRGSGCGLCQHNDTCHPPAIERRHVLKHAFVSRRARLEAGAGRGAELERIVLVEVDAWDCPLSRPDSSASARGSTTGPVTHLRWARRS